MSARVELLSQSVEDFGGRLAELEKAQGISPSRKVRSGRTGTSESPGGRPHRLYNPTPQRRRKLARYGRRKTAPDPRGRPKGSGYYARMRRDEA